MLRKVVLMSLLLCALSSMAWGQAPTDIHTEVVPIYYVNVAELMTLLSAHPLASLMRVSPDVPTPTGASNNSNVISITGTDAQIGTLKQEIAKIDTERQLLEVSCLVIKTLGSVDAAKSSVFDLKRKSKQTATGLWTVNFEDSELFLSNDAGLNFAATLMAYKDQNKVKTLAKPRAVVPDRGVMGLFAGTKIFFLTSVYTGPQQALVQTSSIDSGVNLLIAVRILPNNKIMLTVLKAEVSEAGLVTTDYLTLNTASMTNTAIIQDGETFIIGGLVQTSESTINSKFPLLGDVPLFGELFKSSRKVTTESETTFAFTIKIKDAATASPAETTKVKEVESERAPKQTPQIEPTTAPAATTKPTESKGS